MRTSIVNQTFYPRSLLQGIVACLILCFCGCGYGKVGDKAYGYARALYTVCNLKNPERLVKVETQLQQATVGHDFSEREKQWLLDIVSQAKRNQWETAAKSARRMISDQIERK